MKHPAPKRVNVKHESNWKEWLAGQYATLTLPSGLIATIRKVNLADLALGGQIPVPLLGKIAQGETIAADASELATIEEFQKNPEMLEMVTLIARAAMVEPAIGDVTDDDHLGIDEFKVQDRLEVFNWLAREANAMLPFPATDEPGGGARGAGGTVRPDAEPAAEARPSPE